MSFIEQPSQIPEPYDLASFSREKDGILTVNSRWAKRKMANKHTPGSVPQFSAKHFALG
jgi:hypothetical protein